MKAKGVLLCLALLTGPMWGSANPSLNQAPASFQLVCPPNVTVDCDEDLTNLSKWGDAYVWKDYKKVSAGTPKVDDQRNTCGIGTITRTWRVEDPYWNWHTCTQVITVRGKGLFDESDITWPKSWTLDTCRANLHPNNLPRDYAYPRFNRRDCAKPAYSYKDEYFQFGPHCAKLIRTWSVIDWCQYKPYPGSTEGKWEHIQVIKVDQKTRPTYECPKDTVIYAPDCDSADVVLDDFIAISKCGDTLEVFNNSPFADSSGNNVSGKYPIGEHEVFYMTEYGCGREVKCKFKITVKSSKPPTPYCKNGIITTLMPMDTNNDATIDIGMREVWASDLDVGSFHPCYPNAKLTFSFSSDTSDQVITFDCNNVGRNEVELWVTDEHGNQSYCITYVVVQNNNPRLPDCMPDSLRTGTIAGHLVMPDGRNISDVEIALFGEDAGYSVSTYQDTVLDQNGNQQIIIRHDTSWFDITRKRMANNGGYRFDDLKRFRYYEVSADKSDDMLNGVDIWDYYTIYFHTLGLFKITDPAHLIAADIDGNGRVNQADQYQLISAIFDPAWPDSRFESWRFYDKSGFDSYMQSPVAMPDRLMQIADLDTRKMDVDFVGIKIGDLDGSVDPAGLSPHLNQVRGDELTSVTMSMVGSLIKVGFDKKLAAGHMMINVPHGIKLSEGTGNADEIFVVQKDLGVYQINWVDYEGVESLDLRLDGSEDLNSLILNPMSFAYGTDGVQTSLRVKNENSDFLELVYTAPNPVSDQLHVRFMSSKTDKYELTIYNTSGRLVYNKVYGSLDEGQTTIVVPVGDLPSGNTYHFRLTNSFATLRGSFIK